MTTLGYKYTKEQRDRMSKAQMGNTNNLGRYGKESNHWEGGIRKHSDGYVWFRLPKDHRYFSMGNSQGYVVLSRLVMAEYLQRPLARKEVTHHINGDVTDNKIENLRLFKSQSEHVSFHNRERRGSKSVKTDVKRQTHHKKEQPNSNKD